jgi:tryprostatin B 6-hydroxylase
LRHANNVISETTGTALTAIIYELARHPAELEKLRAELFSIDPGPSGEYPLDRLTSLPHLNGFVNEILRLYPPIPSWAPRKTPSEGTTIRGTYIPGNMNVNCPQWVIGRSEEVYERPLEIIPERWYARQELIKEKAAFAPFNSGMFIDSFS